jgi:nitrilase
MSESSKGRVLGVALCQPNPRGVIDENLKQCGSLLDEAAKRGAHLAVLPENFAFMGPEREKVALGESVGQGGPILSWARQAAAKRKLWVLLGGFPEKSPEPEKVYNASVLLDSDGEVRARYRKIHLFDVELSRGPTVRESDAFTPGDEVVCAETPWLKLGLSICYDLRFPELYRRLMEKGAEAICVPAAFTDVTGKAHWRVLVRARAIENLCFVLAADLTGRHYGNRASFGHSMIVDPWGRVRASIEDDVGVCSAEIDLSEVEQRRRELPAIDHRRADLLHT